MTAFAKKKIPLSCKAVNHDSILGLHEYYLRKE
jgi:hypothetical protein